MSTRNLRYLMQVSSIKRGVAPDNIPPEIPEAPSDLIVVATLSDRIALSWEDNSFNETGFEIERSDTGGGVGFSLLDTVGPDVTSYFDNSVQPEETWFYRVRATGVAGDSGYSGEDSATTPSANQLKADFNNPTGNIITGQNYNLEARVLNFDDTIFANYDSNDWDFDFLQGSEFAVISGPNGNILTPDIGDEGNQVEIRAQYVGPESLDPNFQDKTFNIVASGGTFPIILDPGTGGGWSTIVNEDGSTKLWSGFSNTGEWLDNDRVEVVSDPNSRFGQVVEKRWFAGETYGGWKGFTQRNIGLWSQIYVRLICRFENNWVWHSGGGKYMYLHNAGQGGNRRNFILGTGNNNALSSAFGLSCTPSRPLGVWDFSSGQGQWTPNISCAPRGEYVVFEWLIGADITPNSGFLRMAIDGEEATNWVLVGSGGMTQDLRSNVDWLYNDNVSDKRIGAALESFLFNGGSGGTIPNNTNIRLSEFVVRGLS